MVDLASDPQVPRELFLAWWSLVGLFVGSFLNVAIHRLPQEGMTVSKPRRSVCPNCDRSLTWRENVPVPSWLVQLGKCKGCGWRIPWRYPAVELLTAALWLAAALATPEGDWALLAVRVLVLSGLVVATFVDFAIFEIPDEISIGGMLLAPLAALAIPRLHADTVVALHFSEGGVSVDRGGALVGCVAGMIVGGGILLVIGWIGKLVYGRDAMGFGDVKLLCGAGGFIGPGGVVVALVVASLVASIAGVGNILRFLAISRSRVRQRGARRSFGRSVKAARVAGRYVPFGPYLALGIGIALLYWNHVEQWM